jgi:drug/metabolite transporter (DMT)-like permease
MGAAFREAVPDVARALELRPTTSFAWITLIGLLRTSGSSADLHAAYAGAMAAVPTSHLVREEMVNARAPKWGGSRLEQASLVFDAWIHRGENPRMWFVVGGALVSLGDDWSRRNRRLRALQRVRSAAQRAGTRRAGPRNLGDDDSP